MIIHNHEGFRRRDNGQLDASLCIKADGCWWRTFCFPNVALSKEARTQDADEAAQLIIQALTKQR